MSRLRLHPETHLVDRIGWLRAAVLGANDGIISTASLIVGVAAAAATQNDVLIAGVAGLVAGAMSMAAGEYVSVSSQSDTEQADLARERKELSENAEFELDELAEIYVKRGVDQPLARQVAQQLMAKDALTAHARDELGISEITTARPVQAALTSAVMFSVGAAMPLLMVVVSPANALVPIVSAASLARRNSHNRRSCRWTCAHRRMYAGSLRCWPWTRIPLTCWKLGKPPLRRLAVNEGPRQTFLYARRRTRSCTCRCAFSSHPGSVPTS
jgi:vacuolar iron transporter family protein